MDDDELAEKDSQKALGNGHFVKKQYRAALEAYSMAIDVDPEDHVLFANRSACHLGLAKWTDAAQDAMMCITIDPLYVKEDAAAAAALLVLLLLLLGCATAAAVATPAAVLPLLLYHYSYYYYYYK